jgi:hypothetical protein
MICIDELGPLSAKTYPGPSESEDHSERPSS